jgi:nicotinamidase-related amidase
MKKTSNQSCLFVVDMINGFVKEGPLADPTICSIIKPIEQIIKDFKQKNYPIVAFCDSHHEDSKEFEAFLPHCIVGTQESELIDELLPYQKDMVLIKKNSTNGFLAPEFISWFKKQPVFTNYIIVGCVTDICVLQLASSMIAYVHQHNLDAKVIISKNTSETYQIENHPRESFNYMAYTLLEQLGVQVYDTIDYSAL